MLTRRVYKSGGSCFTSVIHICGDLDVTHQCVDWQIIEVFVFFKGKFSS